MSVSGKARPRRPWPGDGAIATQDDARYLFIVNRGDRLLHQHAVRTFAQTPQVRVIYDRRVGERRRGGGAMALERRRAERRVHARIDADIREYGAAMVRIRRGD